MFNERLTVRKPPVSLKDSRGCKYLKLIRKYHSCIHRHPHGNDDLEKEQVDHNEEYLQLYKEMRRVSSSVMPGRAEEAPEPIIRT